MTAASDVFDRIARSLADVPPMPRALIARFDVPMDRMFRMWDTRGGFVIYVHRGMLLSEAVHLGRASVHTAPGSVALGIPVFFE